MFSNFLGNCQVVPKRLHPESTEWAKLENAPPTTVAEYVDNLLNGKKNDRKDDLEARQQTYLFDWSLYQHVPQLAEEITIPKYFSGECLQ